MRDANIVIVNWKMRDDIDRCLNSFFNDIKESALDFVVHVVDNSGNIDGIKELLAEKYPLVRYVDAGGNVGFGQAQNIGFHLVEARLYVPLNPDVEFIVGSKILEKIFKYMEDNPRVGIVGPKLFNMDGSVQLSSYRFPAFWDQIARRLELDKRSVYFKKRVDYYLMRDFNHASTAPVDWVMGSFMAVRGEMAKEIGFFDDRFFMYFEDCDWCRRAWRAGWSVHYVHYLEVKHGHRRESAGKTSFSDFFKNPVSRVHLKSWLKYFLKWGLRREKRGI